MSAPIEHRYPRRRRRWHCAVALLLVSAPAWARVERTSPLQLNVSVDASDPNGRALTYRWRSSDGTLVDQNAPTTTWTLPDGPGLHFAYVLVSNGYGGYTEQRVIANTDTIGTPIPAHAPSPLVPPPAPPQVGDTYRRFSFRADALFYARAQDDSLRFPAVGLVKSDLKHQIVFQKMTPVPVENSVWIHSASHPDGPFSEQNSIAPDSPVSGPPPTTNLPPGVAVTDTHFRVDVTPATESSYWVSGQVKLADGSLCGTQNEFFGVEATAEVEVRDAAEAVVAGPTRVDAWGFYELDFPSESWPATLVVRCENATPVTVAIPEFGADPFPVTIPATARPTISGMTASLMGTVLGRSGAPTGELVSRPSDHVTESDKFLAYKGLDSRLGGCLYYKAIGAVANCDRDGRMIGAVRFDDWKRTVEIGPYARPGSTEYVATYINKADLNLTRNHHAISYGPDQTAAYVCNHLGPAGLDPGQAEIDQVIDDALAGKNLVACVAMDFMSAEGVNGGQPFVRFLIFGPSGELLPSVNLDGRREKFVPGTCVVCHGGDRYTARFPENGTGPANIGAHFLPYDLTNFYFSSKVGLREVDQEAALHALNLTVLNAGPTVAAQELIAGWYANGTFDHTYLPASWQGRGELAENFYRKVLATNCRGCHVNLAEGFNWDHYPNLNDTNYRSTDLYEIRASIGGCDEANPNFRMHSMPNSAVTFDRFWSTAGTAEDLPQLFDDFYASIVGKGADPLDLTCVPTRP